MVDDDFERLRDIVRGDVDWEPEEEWARIDRMEADRDRLVERWTESRVEWEKCVRQVEAEHDRLQTAVRTWQGVAHASEQREVRLRETAYKVKRLIEENTPDDVNPSDAWWGAWEILRQALEGSET